MFLLNSLLTLISAQRDFGASREEFVNWYNNTTSIFILSNKEWLRTIKNYNVALAATKITTSIIYEVDMYVHPFGVLGNFG